MKKQFATFLSILMSLTVGMMVGSCSLINSGTNNSDNNSSSSDNNSGNDTNSSSATVSNNNGNNSDEYSVANLGIATTTGDLLGHSGYNTDAEVLRGLYDAGFRNIDLSMYKFTPESPYMQDNWREEVLELKEVADGLGMKFVQAHSQGGNPLSTNPQEAEFLVEATIRSIEICEVLGIENTVVHAGWGEFTKEEWFRENKTFYERLLPTAERCGVNVLCENSTSKNMGSLYYINTGKDMLEFIKYVNHPNFHGCWDTGHANCEAGSQYDDIITLGEEMYAIHYADNLGDGDTHLLPFVGNLDPNQVIRALQETEFDGYFTLECDGRYRASGDWFGPQLPGLKNLSSMTRLEQETLLYQAAEYILNEKAYLQPISLDQTAKEVLASASSYTHHYHGRFKSISSTENVVKVGGTRNYSNYTGFAINKSAIEEWLTLGFKYFTFTVGLSAYVASQAPMYVDIYIPEQYGDYHLTTPDKKYGTREYYYANGKTVKLDLELLNAHLSADQGLQFVFLKEGEWVNTGDAYLTFSNISFSK